MKKVLFLCTENSCRSQMAEGIINYYLSGEIQAFSAGVRASRVNPRAIQVMAEIGINISNQRSKSLDEFRDDRFDLAVTLCDQAQKECPIFLAADRLIHVGFPDPAQATGPEAEIMTEFRRVRDAIRQQMVPLLRKELLESGTERHDGLKKTS
ncbi:arsenate reductase ArsC [Desulfobacca acetoxidans]|uniref:Protein tyrosine phosphatase n=1 Tax=Desulfobacca acetoxidans (strain ATCC 700848 / DSM 11109 / ASRB2) TaxID=880072 RepID=F2NHV8_DESAR|nr:arsenate reductase ArsC [Desulfobacca acetoxidans]AEB09443.1 protein tyrosine phosphatase [Desulfobacca acetoxidans DSM 11109]